MLVLAWVSLGCLDGLRREIRWAWTRRRDGREARGCGGGRGLTAWWWSSIGRYTSGNSVKWCGSGMR